jgi:hypothetical protein
MAGIIVTTPPPVELPPGNTSGGRIRRLYLWTGLTNWRDPAAPSSNGGLVDWLKTVSSTYESV